MYEHFTPAFFPRHTSTNVLNGSKRLLSFVLLLHRISSGLFFLCARETINMAASGPDATKC